MYQVLLFKFRRHLCKGSIGHIRYINILTWLRGFQVKLLYLVLFSLYPSLFWELRDKRNLKNLQFDPKASEPCLNIDISNVAYLRILVPRHEASLLLVSTKNRDLWIPNSRISLRMLKKIGPGQRSRFLVLAKRSSSSGRE